ncbi:conserved hypothetical protein [Ricinus communis]|uniref:Uncharacterized protein n=1 Tax=Ricinus communis TaxID=3988 RepID=B9R9Z1_RICCO|nr:conserved hypothetical protein [Ricinus communis]
MVKRNMRLLGQRNGYRFGKVMRWCNGGVTFRDGAGVVVMRRWRCDVGGATF